MKLIITFSARDNGNCGQIAQYIASEEDRIVHYHALHAHACADCGYECFSGACKFRDDGVYDLYASMTQYERVVLIVPMYGGNPASLYFAFSERGQDFFRTEEAYDAILERLYIIGVYGSRNESPDFYPCLDKWFAGTEYRNRVLGLARHTYGQKMADSLLNIPDVREQLDSFIP